MFQPCVTHQNIIDACKRVFQSLTVDIWRQINDLYKREEGLDGRALCVFVTSAVVLLTARFFCVTDFITGFTAVQQLLPDLPHGELYPLLYWALTSALNYCLLPLCVIIFIFRSDLRDFGIRIEQGRVLFMVVDRDHCSSSSLYLYGLYYGAILEEVSLLPG